MLEVGAVERARRPHDDGGLALGRRRHRAHRGQQQRRVVVDRPHAVGREQLRHQAGHRDAVLQYVGDARGRAHVVLQDLPGAVRVAHEIAAGDVRVDAAGGPHAVHRPGEMRATDDQRPGHDARVDDLPGVVDVVDEVVERPHTLGEPALDVVPLLGRDDARDEVERKRAVAHGAVLALRVEGDALLGEDRVAPVSGGEQALSAQLRQFGGEGLRELARAAIRVEDLVVEGARGLVRLRWSGGIGHRLRLMPGPSAAAHRHLSKGAACRLDRRSAPVSRSPRAARRPPAARARRRRPPGPPGAAPRGPR